MALTNRDENSILDYLEDEIHAIIKIHDALATNEGSDMLELKPGCDAGGMKKDHFRNIIQTLRYVVRELGVSQIPKEFTRKEMEDRGIIEE